MNVASLDLCRELYELSGWYKGQSQYSQYSQDSQENGTIKNIPRYDLEFLLRKLAIYGVEIRYGDLLCEVSSPALPGIVIRSSKPNGPEDDVCRLAIELIKKGILHVK